MNAAIHESAPLADALITGHLERLPAPEAAIQSLTIVATRPPEHWDPCIGVLAEHLQLPTEALRLVAVGHIRTFQDNPEAFAQQQLGHDHGTTEAARGNRWVVPHAKVRHPETQRLVKIDR